MADVKIVKSLYTGSIVTSLGELAAADNAAIPGSLSIGSLAGFLFGTAGAVSALGASSRFAVGSMSWNVANTGIQAVTGLGFQPGAVIVLATITGTTGNSIGFGVGTTSFCLLDYAAVSANSWANNGYLIVIAQAAGAIAYAALTSMDAGGFTITWANGSSPTGSCTWMYLAIR